MTSLSSEVVDLGRKRLFGHPASERSVSARVLVGPQIISNQLRPICRMASGCHVCISLRSFTSAAQDTTFPIRSTPTLLHRFPAQMNGRIVIALPLSNDAQLFEAIVRRYSPPPPPSPDPDHLWCDFNLLLAGTDCRMQECGVLLAIAVVNQNHHLENIMFLEGFAGDGFTLFDNSTC